jgi:hypothetical protein
MDLSPAIAREARSATPVATLRRFAVARRTAAPAPEYCDLCRAPLAAEHRHLLEMATRKKSARRARSYWRAHGVAMWDRALEQLLPALESTEVPV